MVNEIERKVVPVFVHHEGGVAWPEFKDAEFYAFDIIDREFKDEVFPGNLVIDARQEPSRDILGMLHRVVEPTFRGGLSHYVETMRINGCEYTIAGVVVKQNILPVNSEGNIVTAARRLVTPRYIGEVVAPEHASAFERKLQSLYDYML